MIGDVEREEGLLAYEQVQAFAALRRKKLPLVYVLFPIVLALAGVGSWRARVLDLAVVCWASAILFALFAAWNWRRLRALDARNRALLARLHAQYGDELPWLAVERQQMAIREIQAEQASPEKLVTGRIALDDQGFVAWFTGGKSHQRVDWSKVESISAFKRDLFSVDLMCLLFKQGDSFVPVEVDENMVGFDALQKLLPQKFERFEIDWMSKIMKPAFAINESELWRRGSSAA